MSEAQFSSDVKTVTYDKEMVTGAINANDEEVQKFLNSFKTVAEVEKKPADWLIDQILERNKLTILAADGGVGKTTLWVNLLSALSSGKKSILDPDDFKGRQAVEVAYFTSEDSTEHKLKDRFDACGADQTKIRLFDENNPDVISKLRIGDESNYLEAFIAYFKPKLIVIDPIQGFIDPSVNMSARNEMRNISQKLMALCIKYDTTFLIICHTNKLKGAFGRKRVADSGDLWDAVRNVFMMGYTEKKGEIYLSHEKANDGEKVDTFLFTIGQGGTLIPQGRTWKRDEEFQTRGNIFHKSGTAPALDRARDSIIEYFIANGVIVEANNLEKYIKKHCGIGINNYYKARKSLEDEKIIKCHNGNCSKGEHHTVELIDPDLIERVKQNKGDES